MKISDNADGADDESGSYSVNRAIVQDEAAGTEGVPIANDAHKADGVNVAYDVCGAGDAGGANITYVASNAVSADGVNWANFVDAVHAKNDTDVMDCRYSSNITDVVISESTEIRHLRKLQKTRKIWESQKKWYMEGMPESQLTEKTQETQNTWEA